MRSCQPSPGRIGQGRRFVRDVLPPVILRARLGLDGRSPSAKRPPGLGATGNRVANELDEPTVPTIREARLDETTKILPLGVIPPSDGSVGLSVLR